MVYIITYAYITIVNLISSTANSEATSDADSTMLFNVTSSPEFRNVEVNSISDAVLWNCRALSVTNYYYRFLYWMLIIAMGATLLGFWVTKFIALITISYCCKKCSWPFAFNEYGLTKLWYIALLEQLKDKIKSNSPSQQPTHTDSLDVSSTLSDNSAIATVTAPLNKNELKKIPITVTQGNKE